MLCGEDSKPDSWSVLGTRMAKDLKTLCYCFAFKTWFLCVVLAVLKLALYASNSQCSFLNCYGCIQVKGLAMAPKTFSSILQNLTFSNIYTNSTEKHHSALQPTKPTKLFFRLLQILAGNWCSFHLLLSWFREPKHSRCHWWLCVHPETHSGGREHWLPKAVQCSTCFYMYMCDNVC